MNAAAWGRYGCWIELATTGMQWLAFGRRTFDERRAGMHLGLDAQQENVVVLNIECVLTFQNMQQSEVDVDITQAFAPRNMHR